MTDRNKLNCALDGRGFLEIDPRLYIQDMEEEIRMDAGTVDRPAYGQRLAGMTGHRALHVIIRFMVKEADFAARRRVINQVNAWAKAGWLTMSTRPGQRIYAVCIQPAESGTLRWNREMQLTLAAYGEAYWQDMFPAAASGRGRTGSVALRPLGTRPCCLEGDIGNLSAGTLNSLSLTAENQTLAFSGLGLAPGKTLALWYDGEGVLHAEAEGSGKLCCRTAESADDLWLQPQAENTVRFSADRECSVTLKARGYYD